MTALNGPNQDVSADADHASHDHDAHATSREAAHLLPGRGHVDDIAG